MKKFIHILLHGWYDDDFMRGLWHFVDTNDYFGCPSYSPFEIPEPADEPGSPQGLGLVAESVQDDLENVPLIELLDLPF